MAVLSSGETTMFQDGPSLNVILRGLAGREAAKRRPARLIPLLGLRQLEKRFCRDTLWLPARIEEGEKRGKKRFCLPHLLGTHALPDNNSGLLPMVVRLCQGNHGRGISRLSVTETDGHTLLFSFTEGKDTLTFPAGRHSYLSGEITVRGELYRTAAAYAFGEDENRCPILKVALCFPELPSARRMVFRKTACGYTVTLSETPGFDFVQKLMNVSLAPADTRPIVEFIKEKLNFRFMMMKAEEQFTPTFPLLDEKTAEEPKKRGKKKK